MRGDLGQKGVCRWGESSQGGPAAGGIVDEARLRGVRGESGGGRQRYGGGGGWWRWCVNTWVDA
jgi:hypothetical protein